MTDSDDSTACSPSGDEARTGPPSQRTVFITGATSGIGYALARVAYEEGHRVIAHGRSAARLHNLVASAPDSRIAGVLGDLGNQGDLLRVEQAISTEQPSMLILNAGYNCRKALASEWTDEEIASMLAVNLLAPIRCARAFLNLPKSEAQRQLALVLSTSCHYVRAEMSLYVTCKMGLMGFGKALQQEGAQLGVRTTLFYPGRTDTGFRSTSHPEYMNTRSVAQAILGTLSLPSDLVAYEFTFRPEVDTRV